MGILGLGVGEFLGGPSIFLCMCFCLGVCYVTFW